MTPREALTKQVFANASREQPMPSQPVAKTLKSYDALNNNSVIIDCRIGKARL